MRQEIIFGGFGGQGILLIGEIFAEAAFLQGKEVAYTTSYGASSRGEKCSSQVVVSDEAIDFPGVVAFDILVIMHQESHDEFISKTDHETKIIFDSEIVKKILPEKANYIPIKADSSNMIMLGAMVAATEIVSLDNVREIVKKKTGRFADKNIQALEQGYQLIKKGGDQAAFLL